MKICYNVLKMNLSAQEIILLVITSISAVDFIIFSTLFIIYLVYIQYKSPSISYKICSFFILMFFIAFKTLHIPAFLANISFFNINFPYSDILLQILTWTNILLAFFPILFAYITIFHKNKKIQDLPIFQKHVNIVMPIYNETPEVLFNAIESVLNLTYDSNSIHLFLGFDNDSLVPELNYLVDKFEITELLPTFTEITVKNIKITICRFKHGGKKSVQNGVYDYIKSIYTTAFLDSSLLFFIDSDIRLDTNSLFLFNEYLFKNGKNAATGIISCITSEKLNFLSFYQDIEYISGQIFWRNMESYFGTTSCLPGAFTILKWTSFSNVADKYFAKTTYDDNFEYQRFYLGEDRYLTHLLMENEYFKIGFCESARCKTDAPDTLSALLKQRKRWFLGHISNDTWLLSSFQLWKQYPLFTLFNFLNNSRNTSIYVYLLYFVLLFNKNLRFISWFLFVILPILFNWLFIIFYAFRLKRKMNIIFYIIIILFQPVLSMFFMYYTIIHIHQQSWGGIRVEKQTNEFLTSS